jgi:hypothetical protein
MSTRLTLESYAAQKARWPAEGKHILAQHDADTVVVYQAYRPSIGAAAAADGRLGGGGFSMSRMSWIKPNFLWMMFRSGWGTKAEQEVTLAIRLTRAGFEEILAGAVASTFGASGYATEPEWQQALQRSSVRLQWDPDHGPGGDPLARRAIQLGLRGESLRRFVDEWTVDIEDISALVTEQRELRGERARLMTPRETVYSPAPAVAARLGLDAAQGGDGGEEVGDAACRESGFGSRSGFPGRRTT